MASAMEVFISYAHKDESLRNELEKHLVALKRQGIVDLWHDRNINAGEEWREVISQHLNSSQLILLLISPDFMHSDYCYSIEMQQAIERHELGEAIVVPIILRPINWQIEPLSKLQALPRDSKAVTLWSNRDSAFLDVANGIGNIMKELKVKRSYTITVPFSSHASSAQMPDPIRKYLEDYPMFYIPQDIGGSFVRTSAESFYSVVKYIYESLTFNQVVWTTDNLNFSPSTQGWFTQYWIGEGLEHLKVNYEAVGRGAKINRLFLVTIDEYANFRDVIDEIGILHAKAGITPYVVLYESVPPHCRYDMAVWGDSFADEVILDLRSNSIVDNYIHWSPYKVKQLMQKIVLIRNLVESDWSVAYQKEDNFQAVLRYAAKIRKQLEALHRNSASKI